MEERICVIRQEQKISACHNCPQGQDILAKSKEQSLSDSTPAAAAKETSDYLSIVSAEPAPAITAESIESADQLQIEEAPMEAREFKKICYRCKQEKTASSDPEKSDFHFTKSSKDGFASACKECKQQMAKDRWANLKKQKQEARAILPEKKPWRPVSKPIIEGNQVIFTEEKPDPPPISILNTSPVLRIDLSDYPDILQNLRTEAKDQLRSPEYQALWILRENLKHGQIRNGSLGTV
jgi:hypothetical protein